MVPTGEGGRTEDVRLGAELDLARLRLPRGGDKQSFCKKEQTEGERQHEILTFSYKMIHKRRHQTKPNPNIWNMDLLQYIKSYLN